MYKVDSTMLWEKRFLDPIVIKAKELGLNQKVDLDQIIVFSNIGIIPSQIDEIKKGKMKIMKKENITMEMGNSMEKMNYVFTQDTVEKE